MNNNTNKKKKEKNKQKSYQIITTERYSQIQNQQKELCLPFSQESVDSGDMMHANVDLLLATGRQPSYVLFELAVAHLYLLCKFCIKC